MNFYQGNGYNMYVIHTDLISISMYSKPRNMHIYVNVIHIYWVSG